MAAAAATAPAAVLPPPPPFLPPGPLPPMEAFSLDCLSVSLRHRLNLSVFFFPSHLLWPSTGGTVIVQKHHVVLSVSLVAGLAGRVGASRALPATSGASVRGPFLYGSTASR